MNTNSEWSGGRTERLNQVQSLITSSREFLGAPPLNAERLRGQALTWLPLLDPIPTARIQPCYETWAESGPRQALRPLDLLEIFRATDDRRVRHWEREAACEQPCSVDGQVLYNCPHCLDQTEQPVWQHTRLGWYRASRGCSCSATSAYRRSAQAIQRSDYDAAGFVLSECGAWACDRIEGRWVKLAELQQHGLPTPDWVVLKSALREERAQA